MKLKIFLIAHAVALLLSGAARSQTNVVDFASLKGSYVIHQTDDYYGYFEGYGVLTLNATGAFTMRINNGSSAFGTFDQQGEFYSQSHEDSPDSPLYSELALTVGIRDGIAVVSGQSSVFDAEDFLDGTYTITGSKIVPAGLYAGTYSVVLASGIIGTDAYGWAVMGVSPSGRLGLSGQADGGIPFTAAGALSNGGIFTIAASPSLQGTTGASPIISGTFRNVPGISDFDGTGIIGSRFIQARSQGHLLNFTAQTGAAAVTIARRNLASTLFASASIAPGDIVESVTSPLQQLAFNSQSTLLHGTGVLGTSGAQFSGCFNDPLPPLGGEAILEPISQLGPGVLLSEIFNPGRLLKWQQLFISAFTPEGTSVTVDVLDADGHLLASNVASGTDLSALPAVATQTALQFRASLSTSNPAVSPEFSSWDVYYEFPPRPPVHQYFSGVVFQKQNLAVGFFADESGPGAVILRPE